MAKPGSSSLMARMGKLDLIYLIFFTIHIPVMLIVDLSPYYPAALRPAFIISLRDFYINTYRDRFFTRPPSWFHAYMALEAVYHVPLSTWAIGALVRGDSAVPLNLLVFALEMGVTTFTCLIEMLSWDGYTREEKEWLVGLYVPYLGLAVVMGVDMYFRLRRALSRPGKETKAKVK